MFKIYPPTKQGISDMLNEFNKPTPEQWQRWYAHSSNKERWLEAQEVEDLDKVDLENL